MINKKWLQNQCFFFYYLCNIYLWNKVKKGKKKNKIWMNSTYYSINKSTKAATTFNFFSSFFFIVFISILFSSSVWFRFCKWYVLFYFYFFLNLLNFFYQIYLMIFENQKKREIFWRKLIFLTFSSNFLTILNWIFLNKSNHFDIFAKKKFLWINKFNGKFEVLFIFWFFSLSISLPPTHNSQNSRKDCFGTEYFTSCVEALLLVDELPILQRFRMELGRKK